MRESYVRCSWGIQDVEFKKLHLAFLSIRGDAFAGGCD